MKDVQSDIENKIANIGDNSQEIIRKLMFRLLPVQILYVGVGSVNGLVSSYFATNFVGIDAMTAVGLYNPFTLLIGAICAVLSGGCAIICGKYLGMNRFDRIQDIFSMDLLITTAIGLVLTAIIAVMGAFDLTGMFTHDPEARQVLDIYMIGQAIGIIPYMLGTQLAPFLSIESMGKRTMRASIIYIASNIIFNFIFVQKMDMGAFGLALASSLGMAVFFVSELQYFMTKKSHIKVFGGKASLKEIGGIILVGFPGAAVLVYLTFRGLILNKLLDSYVGTAGISAFATANNLLNIFWAIQGGMLAVSRLLISVSVGEEDRKTLTDIMRVMMKYFMPLMIVVDMAVFALAVPMTYIFYKDPSQDVFTMTVWGIRIICLAMPLEVFVSHFSCYEQICGRQIYVNALGLLDGVVCVSGSAALLIGMMGYNGVCFASVLNGIICMLFVILFAWIFTKRMPRSIEDLMMIPGDFGVSDDERIDITVRTTEEAVEVAEKIQAFCLGREIDQKRSYYAALAAEEMVVNIVEHGFHKDDKPHSVDVRLVHKDDKVILRIKDDCVPFDPKERSEMFNPDDPARNMGIRMIYKIMKDIEYRNTFGLNVLTFRI
ncbi:MAG: hypothetical protein E7230_06600 [Clostridiales bacterium]|nr:hypothetical protein [Clostridiales bacterium]